MNFPLVSVVLPVYNAEKYIVECLESIAAQSYANWELIIINDGSTDSSEKLIEIFIKNCSNHVQYLISKHKGLPFCLNLGITHAQGKYIARMDADDVMLETRLEQQVNFMEKKPETGILGTNFVEIDENGNELGTIKMPIGNDLIKQKFLTMCAIAHPTVMARREILIANKYLDKYPFPEDYELWTRLIETTNFENLQIILLKKRFHKNEITYKAGSFFIFDGLKLMIAFNKRYNDKLPIYIILKYSLMMLMTNRMRYFLRIQKLRYIKLMSKI